VMKTCSISYPSVEFPHKLAQKLRLPRDVLGRPDLRAQRFPTRILV
jgi:hypothetical protein